MPLMSQPAIVGRWTQVHGFLAALLLVLSGTSQAPQLAVAAELYPADFDPLHDLPLPPPWYETPGFSAKAEALLDQIASQNKARILLEPRLPAVESDRLDVDQRARWDEDQAAAQQELLDSLPDGSYESLDQPRAVDGITFVDTQTLVADTPYGEIVDQATVVWPNDRDAAQASTPPITTSSLNLLVDRTALDVLMASDLVANVELWPLKYRSMVRADHSVLFPGDSLSLPGVSPAPIPTAYPPNSDLIELVGRWGTSTHQDVVIAGGYAYALSHTTLDVLDISNPAMPVRVGRQYLSGVPWDITLADGYAYVATLHDGLQIVDVSYPAAPVLVGGYDTPGYAYGIALSDDYAYVADQRAGLQIIDVSNPAAPVRVGGYDTPGLAVGIALAGGFAYVADGVAGLQIIDVSNPAAPVRVGGYDTSGYASGITLANDYAYVADGDAGLQILGLHNPILPVPLGGYDTSGSAVSIAVANGYAYVADSDAGLQIIDVFYPSVPARVGGYDTSGSARGIALANGYAYVADYSDGLQIINVSNLAKPTRVGGFDEVISIGNIAVAGSYIYVTDYHNGLRIFDISNPATPVPIVSVDLGSGNAKKVALANDYAYVLYYLRSGSFSMQIVDVSNPTTPKPVKGPTYYDDGISADIALSDDGYAYIATNAGIHIIDVRNPAAPVSIGNPYDTPGDAYGIALSDDYAYVADQWAGLQIIDVSNPAAPVRVGGYDTPGQAKGIALAGGFAYVADGDAGLQIIDVSNPAAPVRVGGYVTPGYASGITLANGYAYVSAGDLQIYRIYLDPFPKLSVTVTASDATASEAGLTTGTFTFTRSGDTSSALTVNYTISGSATAGSDFTSLGTSVTITAGATSATLTVTPLQDSLVESDETVILTLATGTGYTVGIPDSATVTLTSDDVMSYLVTATAGAGGSISPNSSTVNHGATTTFTVTPDTGYSINSVSGCGGSLSGNTYTTGSITGACTVTASFSQNLYQFCDKSKRTLTNTIGPGSYNYSSEAGIDTQGTVIIRSDAEVVLTAPKIQLNPGFRVESGAQLSIKAQSVTCPK